MDLVETLTQNMGDFSPSTLNWVNNIVAKSTREVGLYLVGILLVLEIAKMFEKANSSNAGIVTLKMFQGISFRAALGGLMVTLSSNLLNFILLIGIGLANLISKNANGAFNVFTLPSVEVPTDTLSIIGELIGALLNPTEALRRGIMVLLLIIIGALVTLAAYVMVWVIVMLRFFQLYVMLALMPVPMASFASEEHDNIGKGYFKRILAYAFQPAVIMVVFGVYHFLSNIVLDLTGLGNPLNLDMEVQFFQNLILAIVFIIVLWQTHKKSSEMFGV
ncbi:type IV secretion system protein [Enterococcus sp. AZ012]|uniref:type IV secretion system protein n=1 Tax=unclassified Enterococcus TaxID=2608891 RepID=UPI003D2C91F0